MCARRRIWTKIGCNRSRVKNIADGNKRSSNVFLAIWISLQCNFTGKTLFAFFIYEIPTKFCVHTRAHRYIRADIIAIFFFKYLLYYIFWHIVKVRPLFCELSDEVPAALTVLTAFRAWCFCCETKYRYTHTAVSNYTELWMNSRVFFLMTIELNVTKVQFGCTVPRTPWHIHKLFLFYILHWRGC